MLFSKLRRALPFWAANAESAWKKYQMYNWSLSDPLVRAYFFEKFYTSWYAYAPFYNHWFASFFAVGAALASCARQIAFNPEFPFRRAEGRRLPTDRMEIYYYSLPYFNSHARNFAGSFRNSIVDNEPDYLDYHPWGIRPNREQNVKRVKFMWSIPYYMINDPYYENATHAVLQKKLEEANYCKPLYPKLSPEDEE